MFVTPVADTVRLRDVSINRGAEEVWPKVRAALIQTVQLVTSFGLTEQTLRADSALLPIAYYLYRRQPPENWLMHNAHERDRAAIRGWLIRSLLKSSGIWGSGLDTLLTLLRDVISRSHAMFPVAELGAAMERASKPLDFGGEEVEDLLDMQYGDRRLFPLLSLLYPFIDTTQLHHVDHVFPKSALSKARLLRVGLETTATDACLDARDRLPNLQLLEGTANLSKSASMPAEWFASNYLDLTTRQAVLDRHDVGMPPDGPADFLDFYVERRKRMKERLVKLLGKAVAPEPSHPPHADTVASSA